MVRNSQFQKTAAELREAVGPVENAAVDGGLGIGRGQHRKLVRQTAGILRELSAGWPKPLKAAVELTSVIRADGEPANHDAASFGERHVKRPASGPAKMRRLGERGSV